MRVGVSDVFITGLVQQITLPPQVCSRAALRSQVMAFQLSFGLFFLCVTRQPGTGVRRRRTSDRLPTMANRNILCSYVSAWTCSLEAALLQVIP